MAEDLFEGADLGEEHVAHRAPRLAVGTDVFGPEEPRKKLIGLSFEGLERQEVLELDAFFVGERFTQGDILIELAGDRIVDADTLQAEVIPGGSGQVDFFDRRDLDVFRWGRQLNIWRQIGDHRDLQLRWMLVGSLLVIGQVQRHFPRPINDKGRGVGERITLVLREGQRLLAIGGLLGELSGCQWLIHAAQERQR